MPTADDLLDQMESNPEAYSEIDYIVVDPYDRTCDVPRSQSVFGVYQDKNFERKYFKCPRIAGDNIDLSTCYVFINYISSGGNVGQYKCEDVRAEGDFVTFTWLLTANVFDSNIDSKVSFSVQAKKTNENGNLANVFNTRPATGYSYATIEGTEVITEQYADIILQLLAKVDSVEAMVVPPRKTIISLAASNWTGSGALYSQVVTANGITSNSKVDLQPSPEQLRDLLLNEIALTAANDNGTLTVFAIGAAPTSDYEMQILVTEVHEE